MKKKDEETVAEQSKKELEKQLDKVESVAPDTPEKKDEETVAEQSKKSEKEGAVVNSRIDAILKLYPQYEELYIDSHGFVFTANTPKNQRNDAVLYKNKYHKK